MTTKDNSLQPHWWRKTLAGAFLGLALAYVLIALFAWYGPGGIDAPTKVQFNMWIISPIWLLIFSFSYLFRTGNSAIAYLGGANILLYGLFFALRGWV